MIKLTSLLTELRVTDLSKESESTKYFLLYKDKLFILDRNSPFKTINSRLKSHVKGHPAVKKTSDYKGSAIRSAGDIQDFIKDMSDLSPDIVAGEYYPENSAIVLWGNVQARSSLNVKKIVQQLSVQNVTMRHLDEPKYDDYKEIEYSPDELKGDIPSIVFHGTLSHQLGSILKYGLDPDRGLSQFSKQGIFHPEHNFFTATFQEALYYAFNAKHQAKHKWDAFPIILEIKIPDKNLVGPDYDYDFSTTTPRYFQRPQEPSSSATMKSMGLSREVGKWSYKGRIPANHIRWVYYYLPFEHKWKKSRPETWTKLLSNYDWETIAYKLGLQGEDQL